MNRKTLSAADAAVMVMRDEDHFFDRKALLASGRTIQKIAVALANADGGEFVIGIADDGDQPIPSERWKGAAKVEDFNPHVQAISEIKPSLAAEYSILDAPGRTGLVLLVRVEKSPEVHQTADGTVYVRKGAQSLPLKDPQRILELQFAKGAASFEDQVLPGVPTEEVSESIELQRFPVCCVGPNLDRAANAQARRGFSGKGTDVVKTDQIDILARTMFRHLEEIDHAEKP